MSLCSSMSRFLHTSKPSLLRNNRSARLPPVSAHSLPSSSDGPTPISIPVHPTTSFSFETSSPHRRAAPRGDSTQVTPPTLTSISDDLDGSSSDEEDELNPATDDRELMAEEGGVEGVEGGFSLSEEAIKSTCAVETLVVGGFDPMHPGIPWVRVPINEGEGGTNTTTTTATTSTTLTLPVPVTPLRANGRWHWHCWSSSGETLGLSTTVHLLAPFLPPSSQSSAAPGVAASKATLVPKTLEQTLAITQLSSRLKSRLKEGGSTHSSTTKNTPSIASPAALIHDPSGLPVYFQVRVLKGLFSSELSGAFSGTPRDLAHLFVDIHSMKSGPAGDLRAVRAARPPVVVDSWEVDTGGGGGGGVDEEKEEEEGKKKRSRVYGIEYESPSGSVAPLGFQGLRPGWGLGGTSSTTPPTPVSRREEVRKAREALELEYSNGGEGGRERKVGGGRGALTHLVTMRHVVTIVCDMDRDVAYELSVGAPVEAWDELWGGEVVEDGGSGAGGGPTTTTTATTTKGWPTPKELGLLGFGLKGMLENATIGGL